MHIVKGIRMIWGRFRYVILNAAPSLLCVILNAAPALLCVILNAAERSEESQRW